MDDEGSDVLCFRCGEPGHVAAGCKARRSRVPRRPQPPPPPPGFAPAGNPVNAQPVELLHSGAPSKRPHEWAAIARQGIADKLGMAIATGERYHDSPFRKQQRMGPITESELIAIAKRQLAEDRAARIAMETPCSGG